MMQAQSRKCFIRLTAGWAFALVVAVCQSQVVGGESAAASPPPAWILKEEQAQFETLQKVIAEQRRDAARGKVLAEQTFRREALILDSDRDPLDVALRRTEALLTHLQRMNRGTDLSGPAAQLAQLKTRCTATEPNAAAARRTLFGEVLRVRRTIALSNPLLNFDRILFVKRPFLRGDEQHGNHMCQQYYGFNAVRAGGLFVLDHAFSDQPVARDILADARCRDGRFQGQKLPQGSYLSPELSYDGKTILFAYTEAEPTIYQWTEKSTYHIFKTNLDGSNLTQLTDGRWNDFDPCFLPNGRIAFISERRGGYGRCHPSPKPNYTLHTMDAEGHDIVCISWHESNEWQPSVNHQGMVIYTRWDYVDRGAFQAHNPWITTPDGRDARAIQGNYGKSWENRPLMEMDLRAIPGSQKLISTAAPHHGQAYGSLVVVDPNVPDDDMMSPFKRLTPEIPFPEAEPGNRTVYSSPWPLSEDFYLAVYDADGKQERGPENNFGIYLVDSFGNKELIYRDPALSCLSPIPVQPRQVPPIVPHGTGVGAPALAGVPAPSGSPSDKVPVGLVNVYESRNKWPAGTTIKTLRIVQVLPKTTWMESQPRIGHGFQKGARAVLGTVPVESDGSAHFNLPADKPVYFQALDERGLAVASMRSDTFVHRGQKSMVCQGCHEPRLHAPQPPERTPLALRREPSEIRPEVEGSNPFSFPRLVQPVLDRNCVGCHDKEPKTFKLDAGNVAKNPDHWATSYINLKPYAFYVDHLLWNAPRTIPGEFGARASRLYPLLEKGHHDLKLSAEDFHRLTLWLDCNSDFYGAYENTEAQAKGEIVRPTLE